MKRGKQEYRVVYSSELQCKNRPAKQKYIPNADRAVCNAKIATVNKGERVVKTYHSSQPLEGKVPEPDAPPFTGFVRGWFRGEKRQ